MTPNVVTHKGEGLATFKASRLICSTLRELYRNSFIGYEVYLELADYITRQMGLGICATFDSVVVQARLHRPVSTVRP